MMLQLESVSRDVSDFWRPRLTAVLDAPRLRAGLYRFRLRTRQPAYATLRLGLDGWPVPMTVFVDRVGECDYAKSFSVPRPVTRVELELEPHLDAGVVVSAELEPVGLRTLLAGRRDVLSYLASPRMLARKVRQVVSGRSGLAFASAARPDERSIYAAWQGAFEGEAERGRVAAELRRCFAAELRRCFGGGRPLKLLMVSCGDGGAAALTASPNTDADVAIVPLVVEGGTVSLGGVLDAAERAGAFAFAFLERPGRWSALAPAMLGSSCCGIRAASRSTATPIAWMRRGGAEARISSRPGARAGSSARTTCARRWRFVRGRHCASWLRARRCRRRRAAGC